MFDPTLHEHRNRMLPPGMKPAFLVILTLAIVLTWTSSTGSSLAAQNLDTLRKTGKEFASVVKKVSSAVVFIRVEKKVQNQFTQQTPLNDPFDLFNDEFFHRFFGDRHPERRPRTPRKEHRVMGQGSGFIVSGDGIILTNNHVVGGADLITVRLHDGRELLAKVIGADPHTDVAVIKVEGKNLPVMELGDSGRLEVGEWVLAFGNPFGLTHTVTAGVVSAKGRSNIGITDYEDFIQTDAAINPGNSGGPLVNLEGQAVGISTAIFSRSGGYMGIGFAIPINMARKIQDQLIASGSVTRGFLGVILQDLTPELASSFGVKERSGLLVGDVSRDSPAEAAGLQRGDVLLRLDGKPIENLGTFRNQIALMVPGSGIRLAVLRDGKEQTIDVKIGKRPSQERQTRGTTKPLNRIGISITALTPEIAGRYGYTGESGVVIRGVQPGSIAAMAGLRKGMLIQEVNRKRVQNPEEFEKAAASAAKDGRLLLLVREGNFSRYIGLLLRE